MDVLRKSPSGARLVLFAVAAAVALAAVAVPIGVHARRAAQADRRKNAQVRAGLETIREVIYAYSKDHESRIPAKEQLNAVGLAGYLPAGRAWPTNPFTSEPMRTGTGPGDIRYEYPGSTPACVYTIDSVGTDGDSVW
jgi:type II secretory pathway pseudopilin PulG